MPDVHVVDVTTDVKSAMQLLCSKLNSEKQMLKKSKKVYIKVNGIDFKKHCFTSPEVLEALVEYLTAHDATVYVMENSTQANMTRVVFAINGYKALCERTGAIPIYLDEEDTEIYEFKGKASIEKDPHGYILKTFHLPKTIVNIMNHRDSITYINLPKLKTHSMAVVTLGIKNQWGFPLHADRGKDHNYNLHSKLVDVYEYIQPDFTIIDGIEGTIHGHYPPTAFADRLVKEFKLLIGGTDTLAVDVVGARIFGLTLNDVPHLKIAYKRGLGEGDLTKINVIGKDLSQYKEKYDFDLLQTFPPDVKIVKGKQLLCREGCQNNPLTLLQVLAYDHSEKFKGGFFIVMGKGFDENLIEQLKTEGYKKGLVSGFCAIEEVGEKLKQAFGKRRVFFSHDCNNLAESTTALCKLSHVSVIDLAPISVEALAELVKNAQKNGSTAIIPEIF
ncbi:MAG: DUF362 domain-containing protein [Candidatus Helarchaeota archaeon]